MLEVKNVSKDFENRLFSKEKIHAVKGVSFSIEKGKTLGIVGNSGCGKSTLARMIAGLLTPTKGDIQLDGISVVQIKKRLKKSQNIQMIFQHPESALDPSMRIRDSLLEPLKIHRIYHRDTKRMEQKLREVMELAHIEEVLLNRYPHQISGGEAQRVCIGRMLMLNPKVVLLDEPTSMLDVSVQAYIMNLLKELQRKMEFTYLIISHDLEILHWICDDILVMNKGEMIEYGKAEEIFINPKHAFTKSLVEAFTYF